MKKLIALISSVGKSKEQLAGEVHEAVQKYFRIEKEVLAKTKQSKKNKKPYIYMAGIIILILAGYFYFPRTGNKQVVDQSKAEADTSEFIDPKEILKYDPNAPAWMQDAESCTRVGGKIFCKLKGE